MSEVKTFRAATMRDALSLVRNELGADAVILHTRQVELQRLLPWSKPRQAYEITAGTEINLRSQSHRSQRRRVSSSQHSQPPTTESTPAPEHLESVPGTPVRASKYVRPHQSSPQPRPLSSGPTPTEPMRPQPVRTEPAPEGTRPPEARSRETLTTGSASSETSTKLKLAVPMSQSASIITADAASTESTSTIPSPAVETSTETVSVQSETVAANPAPSSFPDDALKQLDQIHQLLKRIGNHPQVHARDVADELFHIYTQLIEADVDQAVARDLVVEVKRRLGPEKVRDVDLCRRTLAGIIETGIHTVPPIVPIRGQRLVVALVGPTGVGKTTTIAKLAANFRLRDGIRMGLVTVDTYRIAAVEQLRTYAEIIDLPMKVVTSPADMRRALDDFSGLDLVLIDTAGRSPKDELRIQELKTLLGEGLVDQVHLVLSMVSGLSSLMATVEKFSAVKPTSAILTKLDEAAGPGMLASLSRKVDLPFSYLTAGQDVPADIEPANAARITRLITGDDPAARAGSSSFEDKRDRTAS